MSNLGPGAHSFAVNGTRRAYHVAGAGSRPAFLENGGHSGRVEQPDEFLEAVGRLLGGPAVEDGR